MALLGACATAGGAGLAPPSGPKIVGLDIVGNDHVSAGLIRGRIATRKSNRFLFFGSDAYLDPGALAQDVRRIEDIYEEQGFYDARVDAETVPAGEAQVRVIFTIREGRPTKIRSLLVDGLSKLPAHQVAAILDDAPLQQGDRLVEAKYVAFKDQLLRRLRDRGYAKAKVTGRVEVGPAEGDADLIIAVDTGKVYEFGPVEVRGAALVPEHKVREASQAVLEEGDRFSPEAMRDAQAEVFALGSFSVVTVTEKKAIPESDNVPVVIGVNEADFLRLRFGVGAGIDQSYYQTRALAEFTHLNLFGGLQRLQWSNELAYRFVSSRSDILGVSGFAGTSSLEFTQPDFITTRVDLALRALYQRELLPAYSSQSISGRVGTPIRFRRWLYFTPSYNIVRFFDVTVFQEGEIDPGIGPRASLVGDCPTGCLLSFLEQRIVADRRSNPLEPRSGWYASLGVQEGGIGGDFAWLRVSPEVRGYLPIFEEWTLASRLQLGWLYPLSSCDPALAAESPYLQAVGCSPIVVRYFAGGADSFRGVGADRLGPLEPVISNDQLKFVPLGGNSLLVATVEGRWYFAHNLGSVFFLDVGNVGANSDGAFDLANLQYAVGTGLRYRTPVGPARLDVAYRFLREPTEPFGGGTPVENSWFDYFAIFLSLGEAF